MPDRHVLRSGDDYGSAFLSLLPQGQAWPKYPGSTLDLACRGLAEYWGEVDYRAHIFLTQESDPRYTIEMLDSWERAWGLPDECVETPQTIAERRRALITKMTMLGGQSRQFFMDIANSIGHQILEIREYAPFMVGISEIGPTEDDSGYWRWEIGPPEIRYYWRVSIGETPLLWWRFGEAETGIDPHLQFARADDLECLLNRLKPAHTIIVFDYSAWGLVTADSTLSSSVPEVTADGKPPHSHVDDVTTLAAQTQQLEDLST